jgi:hypothetical protein
MSISPYSTPLQPPGVLIRPKVQMYAPPSAPAPRSGKNPLKIVLLVMLFVGVPCIVGTMLVFNVVKKGLATVGESFMPIVSCSQNIELARDALVEYANEKGTFPAAAKWQDEIEATYRKKFESKYATREKKEVLGTTFEFVPFRKGEPWGCEVGKDASGKPKYTGLAFNSDLAGKAMKDIPDSSLAIVLFETPKGAKNLAMKYEAQPKASAPSALGQPREWIKAPMTGAVEFNMAEGSSKAKVRVSADGSPGQ